MKEGAVIMKLSVGLLPTGRPGKSFLRFSQIGIQVMALIMNSLDREE